ncbi:MAG TPA: helix-turn-helix domain-containing protein, partial [Acidimicrobiia bacterium]|nr:helix-turn-helix domain-containing protein [Acidimicrobiia bacterium]
RRRMPEPLLTLKEAADYLRLTPSALYTQRHRGEKPGALGIRVGRKVLFRPSDIERFLEERLAEAFASHGH